MSSNVIVGGERGDGCGRSRVTQSGLLYSKPSFRSSVYLGRGVRGSKDLSVNCPVSDFVSKVLLFFRLKGSLTSTSRASTQRRLIPPRNHFLVFSRGSTDPGPESDSFPTHVLEVV